MVMPGRRGHFALRGVDEDGPERTPAVRDRPGDRLLAGVEQHHQRATTNAPAARVAVRDLVAVEDHPQRSLALIEPLRVAHLSAGGQKPGDVLTAGPVN